MICLEAVSYTHLTCIFEKETEKERNAHSLVLCTHYKDLHMLFTGDMGISEETELLKMAEIKGSIQQEHLKHCLLYTSRCV